MKRIGVIGLHVCYWGMYTLMVILFLITVFRTAHFPFRLLLRGLYMPGAFFFGPGLLAFYLCYGFCFRLLRRKQLMALGATTVAVSLGSALVVLATMRWLVGNPVLLRWSWDTVAEIGVLSFIAFINGIMALVVRGFVAWYDDIWLQELLRRRSTEMELALLKSQLNPHFLFNTLNNIDVLIEKDAVRASDYLNKLSDLLRFMLYEAGTERIPMGKELEYIERYIELQRIRTAHPESIHYTVEGEPGRWMVAPMLFLPFIENAFKHTEKKAGEAIRIRFELQHHRIVFDCENRCRRRIAGAVSPDADAAGGLGNSLIRKRLDLLYPGKHHLAIDAGEDRYKATLILENHEA
jgi:two-component system LytT family sensor kinase